MKRAIYVGKTELYPYAYPSRHPLHYGMTGDFVNASGSKIFGFIPDGKEGRRGSFVSRDDVYIPSEDKTRHCPKP